MKPISSQSSRTAASAMLSALLMSGAIPAEAQAKKTMVCNDLLPEPVLFGRAYQQSDGRWTTEGTWEIPPGRCVGIFPPSSKPFIVHYAVLYKDLSPLQYGGRRGPMLCLGIPKRSDDLVKISNQPRGVYTDDSKSITRCTTNGVSRGLQLPFIQRTVNPGENLFLKIPGGWNVRPSGGKTQ